MPRKKTIKRKRYRRKTRGGDRTVPLEELRSKFTEIVNRLRGFEDRIKEVSRGDLTNGATVDRGKLDLTLRRLYTLSHWVYYSLNQYLEDLPSHNERSKMETLKRHTISHLEGILEVARRIPLGGPIVAEIENEFAFVTDKFDQILQMY
jgi:hypothetical protein